MIKLSPSQLNLYLECPRCFWLERVKKFKRPRGVFPSLPGGMDRIIKPYFDIHRLSKTMPEQISKQISGKLVEDVGLMETWRNWRSGALKYEDSNLGVVLVGALDDCFQVGNKYPPLDYKTRGAPPKGGSIAYYGNQLSCYGVMLDANKYPSGNVGYLAYFWPSKMVDFGKVKFDFALEEIPLDKDRVFKTIEEIVKILKKDTPPMESQSCDYCNYIKQAKLLKF